MVRTGASCHVTYSSASVLVIPWEKFPESPLQRFPSLALSHHHAPPSLVVRHFAPPLSSICVAIDAAAHPRALCHLYSSPFRPGWHRHWSLTLNTFESVKSLRNCRSCWTRHLLGKMRFSVFIFANPCTITLVRVPFYATMIPFATRFGSSYLVSSIPSSQLSASHCVLFHRLPYVSTPFLYSLRSTSAVIPTHKMAIMGTCSK